MIPFISRPSCTWAAWIAVLLLLPGVSSAATNTWTGAVNNNWNNAGNWSGNVPVSTEDVIIPNGSTVNAAADTVAQNLNALTLNGGTLTFAVNFADNGNGTFGADAGQQTLAIGTVTINAGTLILSGRVITSTTGEGVTFNANAFTIETGATVHSNGRGFGSENGPGGSTDNAISGAHGGRGGGRAISVPYGAPLAPITLGSGGGYDARDTSGGGAIKINCPTGNVSIKGLFSANGNGIIFGIGGSTSTGAGGSLYIVCDQFLGDGTLEANGGNNPNGTSFFRASSGAGGRIGISYNSSTFTGTYECRAGTNINPPARGLPGTLALPESVNLDITFTKTVGLAPGNHTFGDLTINNNALFYMHSDRSTALGCRIDAQNITLAAGATISADWEGFRSREGPGAGTINEQGGSHGGRGGSNTTNGPNGAVDFPTNLGSGGGYANQQMKGGGAIRLRAPTGTIKIDGTVTTEGRPITGGIGGSTGTASGGSILIECATFEGLGMLKTLGADNPNGSRTGGGGRIAIHYTTSTFTGSTSAAGGVTTGTAGEVGSTAPGSLDVADHTGGQATDLIGGAGNYPTYALYKFNLLTRGNTDDSAFEDIQITRLVFDLSNVGGILDSEITNLVLLDGVTPIPIANATVSVIGINGTLTLDFNASDLVINSSTASRDYTLQADLANIVLGDKLTIGLNYQDDRVVAAGTLLNIPVRRFNATNSTGFAELAGTALAGVTHEIPGNAPPTSVNDAYAVLEDAVLNVPVAGVLANDGDADGNGITALLISGPSNGNLTLNLNGSFSYDPNPNFVGTDSFTYVANDSFVNGNTATVTITINTLNDAPIAFDDTFKTENDVSLSVVAPGLLANDTDVENDPLTALLISGPANGSLTLNPNGSFFYTPNSGFVGIDSFTYAANDAIFDSNTATVSIQVFAGLNANPSSTPAVIVAGQQSSLGANPTGGSGTYVTFNWSGPNGFSSTQQSPGALTFPDQGFFTYVLTVTDSEGFVDSANVSIAVLGSALLPNPSADPFLLQIGESTNLSSNPTGGSGVYTAFNWSGPNGFTSSQQNPGAVTPSQPGPHTYSLTVTDASGLTATASVNVIVGLPFSGLYIGKGGVRYRVASDSSVERPTDSVKLVLRGLPMAPGDKLALMLNDTMIGDLTKDDGLTLDPKGRATGQLGSGPNIWTRCRAKFQSKRNRLTIICRKGVAPLNGQPMVSSTSGKANKVLIVVLIDRAPADGIIDVAGIVPITLKVNVRTRSNGSVLERGKGRSR